MLVSSPCFSQLAYVHSLASSSPSIALLDAITHEYSRSHFEGVYAMMIDLTATYEEVLFLFIRPESNWKGA